MGQEGSSLLCSVLSRLFPFVFLCSAFLGKYVIFLLFSKTSRGLVWCGVFFVFSALNPVLIVIYILLGLEAGKMGSAEGPGSLESDRVGSGVGGKGCLWFFVFCLCVCIL